MNTINIRTTTFSAHNNRIDFVCRLSPKSEKPTEINSWQEKCWRLCDALPHHRINPLIVSPHRTNTDTYSAKHLSFLVSYSESFFSAEQNSAFCDERKLSSLMRWSVFCFVSIEQKMTRAMKNGCVSVWCVVYMYM